MSCMTSKLSRIASGTMVAAIGISLSIGAMAQDSPRLRTPRRLVPGVIKHPDLLPDTSSTAGNPNTAQGPGPAPLGPGPGCNVFPASASIGTAVPLSYFGPPPSTVNQSLVGPVQLLDTGQIDSTVGTITIPLYLGHMKSGQNVWYILTDVDDPGVAAELGLNFSAKMSFMGNAVRTANIDQNADLVFNAGTVDFSATRSVTPGPAGSEFPPTAFQPGSVGDSAYSPF